MEVFRIKTVITIVICLGCVEAIMIPSHILDCYRNLSVEARADRLPMSMLTLVELVRKVEMFPDASLDLRTMAYTLLHKFRLDGIQRDPNAGASEYVVPINLLGTQYSKHQILMEKLLAGNSEFFPEGSLTSVEMCAMHMMLSSSVDPWLRGDEASVCPNSASSRSQQLFYGIATSSCPVEKGVVQTSWGTVSPGQMLAAIATSLQPQNVWVANLVTQDPTKQEQFQRLQMLPASATVSNIWAVTLAGDLAEVAVYQGPRTGPLILGSRGKWNDSLVPQTWYLQNGSLVWDLTDAELLAGVDGLILAGKLNQWMQSLNRLRLSQVLEMYYSYRGISFDPSYRACMRSSKVDQVLDRMRLLNETTNFARVLYYNTQSVQLSSVEDFSRKAVDAFNASLNNALSGLICGPPLTSPPRVHLHVVMDQTWQGSEAMRLLAHLAETIDVSPFGSTMGVVSGSVRGWMLNTTRRYTDVLQAFNSSTIWPTNLNLQQSLSFLLNILKVQSAVEHKQGIIGGLSNVVLVLAYSSTISDEDFQSTLKLFNDIETQTQDIHFMFVTSSLNYKRFSNLIKQDSVNYNTVIEASDSRPETMVARVVEKLYEVPARLVSALCLDGMAESVKGEFEDYVTPNRTSLYRIHPDYLQGVQVVQLQFRGSGYGDLMICLSRTPTGIQDAQCKLLNGNQVITMNITKPCEGTQMCQPIFLRMTVHSTLNKCAEDDCRFPDHVRFTLMQQGLRCYEPTGESLTTDFPDSAAVRVLPYTVILPVLVVLLYHSLL